MSRTNIIIKKTVRDRYNTPELKHALKQMYKGNYCYCENKIGLEAYKNIEHLKSISRHSIHMLAIKWENLHWCCEKCNKKKKAKWNAHYPIVDPTKDDPNQHIKLNVITGELEAITRRGKGTINDPELNREELVEARKAILVKLNMIHLMVLGTPTLTDNLYFKTLLQQFIHDDIEYSSLMERYIQKWEL